jgi:O-antigen/teichoic acid export membrane protein
MPAPGKSRFLLEIGSAYLAAAARVAAWAAVSAFVYRRQGAVAFALLALVRGTLTALNQANFGLLPAMIRLHALWSQQPPPIPAHFRPRNSLSWLFLHGAAISLATLALGLLLTLVYSAKAGSIHDIPPAWLHDIQWLALTMGIGCALRLGSESAGAVLQCHRHITLDNLLAAVAELAWIPLSFLLAGRSNNSIAGIGLAYACTGAILLAGRSIFALSVAPLFTAKAPVAQSSRQTTEPSSTPSLRLPVSPSLSSPTLPSPSILLWLLQFGLIVSAASCGDFLFGPTASLLINWNLTSEDLAAYSAALQIDAALLLVVAGPAVVLLPRTAHAVGRRDWHTVRKYYVIGTAGTFAMLAVAAAATWLAAPRLLGVWLKDPPALTLTVLPLVLIHNVTGGSAGIGRSVMLALGKVKTLTVSSLLAGLLNVLLCAALLHWTNLGVRSAPLATITAVTLRNSIWMPWFVLRTIRRQAA